MHCVLEKIKIYYVICKVGRPWLHRYKYTIIIHQPTKRCSREGKEGRQRGGVSPLQARIMEEEDLEDMLEVKLNPQSLPYVCLFVLFVYRWSLIRTWILICCWQSSPKQKGQPTSDSPHESFLLFLIRHTLYPDTRRRRSKQPLNLSPQLPRKSNSSFGFQLTLDFH